MLPLVAHATTYTSTTTTQSVKKPTTTVVETVEDVTLDATTLAKGAKTLLWEVFNRDSDLVPEVTSTEKAPRFSFKKDGLKKVILTTTDENDITQTKEYDLVTTLAKPVIAHAVQYPKIVRVRGKASANAVVLVYIFSEPQRFQTTADDKGNYVVSIDSELVGDGPHIATAVAISKEASKEVGFIEKVDDVVEAQINSQLNAGDVLTQDGDRPLIVAQPIASDPREVEYAGFDPTYLYLSIGLLALLLLVGAIVKHMHHTMQSHPRRQVFLR